MPLPARPALAVSDDVLRVVNTIQQVQPTSVPEAGSALAAGTEPSAVDNGSNSSNAAGPAADVTEAGSGVLAKDESVEVRIRS